MKISEYEIFLNIAGFNIYILFPKQSSLNSHIFIKDEIKIRYKGFLMSTSPTIIDYEIQFIEKKLIGNSAKKRRLIRINHPINIYQFQYILRIALQTLLKKNNGFFLHASANNMNGKANLFLGKNKAGKSTISQLLGDKYSILADDMVIIRKKKKLFNLYQSPYIEKNQNFERGSGYYLIDKILFLKKASFCKLEKLENKKIILQKILDQLYTDEESKMKQVKYIFDLILQVNKFYTLYFTKEGEKLKKLFN